LGLFPGRGLLYSFLAHEIAVFALLLFWPVTPPRPSIDPVKHWQLTMIPKEALYLPDLGGDDSAGQPGGASASESQTAPRLTVGSWSELGLSLPGVGAIISNPRHPTNHVQTILQPALSFPHELTMFAPLPNTVRLAETIHAPLLQGPIDAPKSASSAPSRSSPAPSGADTKTELALSVMPAPPDPAPKFPAGEAHGQFAIAVLPNLLASHLVPGSAPAMAKSAPVIAASPASVGTGTGLKADAHETTATNAPSARNGKGPGPGGSVPGTGPGQGAAESGHGANAAIANSGITIRGSTFGADLGADTARDAGAGDGPAARTFPGMTIQGGEWPDGVPADLAARPSPNLPAPNLQAPNSQDPVSYGLTIVSAGTSGGGLGDFGVFYDEPVFTVYINMAGSSDPAAPSWILQYAPLRAADSGGDALAPPLPAKKETPVWPPELLRRYRNQLMVVYVVIDEMGRVQRVKTMQTPNIQFNAPLLAALEDWEFHPASSGGKPIAVRALLGVPVTGTSAATQVTASPAPGR
jgi:hypothetical protein